LRARFLVSWVRSTAWKASWAMMLVDSFINRTRPPPMTSRSPMCLSDAIIRVPRHACTPVYWNPSGFSGSRGTDHLIPRGSWSI